MPKPIFTVAFYPSSLGLSLPKYRTSKSRVARGQPLTWDIWTASEATASYSRINPSGSEVKGIDGKELDYPLDVGLAFDFSALGISAMNAVEQF